MGNIGPVSSKINDIDSQKVALRQDKRSLTYGELNRQADALATYLFQTGLRPSASVGICLQRSFDWVIAALAVMRAGAAYVPMDDAWPDERIRYALSDSAATHLIAPADRLRRLQPAVKGVDPRALALSAAGMTGPARPQIAPGDLAYIIYTSGTSGYPKGVEITHANLAHLVQWHLKAFKIGDRDRASHLAGLAFDAAGWEIWPNLAAGASISIVDEATRASAELLQQWLLSEEITVSYVPTALCLPLTELTWPAATPLRFLLTGGEKLRRAPRHPLPFAVVNNYGPTECTVVSTSGAVDIGSSLTPSIGPPIDRVSVHILDANGAPVPRGTVGEIYVGGPGVGRGYRNLPDLTARCFLRDPFSRDPGARMYRTGDLALRLPNGQIEFCGRADSQEKILGHRIEMEEIVSLLYQYPKVKFATVLARSDGSEDKRLTAYVMPMEGDVPTSQELQEFLAHKLPAYMVPAAFVRLTALPLSPNGKVDERLLESPSSRNLLPSAPDLSAGAANPLCQRVLDIVRQLLRTDAVGPQDDFFLVGGHSLLGTQLILRVRSAFQVEISLRDLFEARTAFRIAELVETRLIAQISAMSEEEVWRRMGASL
jgi:amino acid adenylation domain-containing protein